MCWPRFSSPLFTDGPMSFTHLPEEQAQRAEQLFESLKLSTEHDLRAIAELLASKPDNQLFGSTEFQLRDLVHRLGTQALQTAAKQRKKGATEVPA
jgi:hypothetical protein